MDIAKECLKEAVRSVTPKASAYNKAVYHPDGDILTNEQKTSQYIKHKRYIGGTTLYRDTKGECIMKTALSIAGSECSGGAGIHADLKTMTMNDVYAMSAITALTAQNTTGVTAIMEETPAFLQQQIDVIFDNICPDAVKIGMVSNATLIEIIADRLIF